ncbi:MAG: hypothetical protein J7L83_00350 [Thaumarchaeota archaeon]|nr:hypothetical protein [Nitrososphaerota archaeon]
MKLMRIVIDSREAVQARGIVEKLRELSVEIDIEPLDAGDYLVYDVLIERKTPTGLLSDVRSKRLWSELDKMKRCEGVFPLLVIEGSLGIAEKLTNWSKPQIIGVVNSVILDWNIPALVLPSRKWLITYLYELAKQKSMKGKERLHPLRAKEKAEKISDRIRFVVEGLPGVSGVRAIKLMKKFKTIKALANASIEELKVVEGIGEKTAKAIYEVLNARFEEEQS